MSVGQGRHGCVSDNNVMWQFIRFFWAQDGLFFWTFKQKYFEWTGILFLQLKCWQVGNLVHFASDCYMCKWLQTIDCCLFLSSFLVQSSNRLWFLRSFVVNLDHKKCGGRTPCAHSLLPGVTWIWSCATLFWAALPFACTSRTCCTCHIWWKGRGLDVQDYQASSPNSSF